MGCQKSRKLRLSTHMLVKYSYADLSTFRWIMTGIIAGVVYAFLVATVLSYTTALPWPEWYQVLFESQAQLGLFIWNVVVLFVPALLIALLVGLVVTRITPNRASAASLVGAVVCLGYVIQSGTGLEGLDIWSVIVVAWLPIAVLAQRLHNKSFNTDASDAGAG